jgi:hypothetical protein
MNSPPELKLDWCSYDAAHYAVQHWHYSRSLPSSKTARIGVWENRKFVGCIVYAWGANKHLSTCFGLKMTECVELCRVALTKHQTPVSRILSIALTMLKRAMPGIRLVVSYADFNYGHVGSIYQAAGWTYVGQTSEERGILLGGRLVHRRTINSKFKTSSISWLRKHIDPDATIIGGKPKHKYILGLDAETKAMASRLSKPYPKRCAASETIDTSGTHPEKRGEAPTAALQSTIISPLNPR